MRRLTLAFLALGLLATSSPARGQSWKGFYVGGQFGGAFQRDSASETVTFDTNLDGMFTDTVRTAAGVDAFSPGFCGGAAASALPAGGCADDENGLEGGGRVGYDWQAGRWVFGGVADLSFTDVTDSVSAFSTTPAFYTFTRTLNMLAGFRGRVGAGSDRVLVYGTAGGAWGWVDQSFRTSNAVNTFVAVNQDGDGDNHGVAGYQAGGGVEFALGGGATLGAEYLFSSLDNREESTIRSQGPAPPTNPFILVNPAGTELRRSDRFEAHSLRVALNYRF